MRHHPSTTALLSVSLLLNMVHYAEDQPGVIPTPIPGEFAIRTFYLGPYLTSRNGGGVSDDAIITSSMTNGVNEKLRLAFSNHPTPQYLTIQTVDGHFLAPNLASNDLGDPARAIQALNTEALSPVNDSYYWMFNLLRPGANYAELGLYTLQTITGTFLTALGGGGKSTAAFHIDAKKADTWEFFTVIKCGELGNNFEYAIKPKGQFVNYFYAPDGGGRVKGAFVYPGVFNDLARFKFIQQPNGSYALQTSNGVNFLTAIRGGGLAYGTADWDNLVTDRTQALDWEQFRFFDQGDCRYRIQTSSGFFIALGPGWQISTDISDPNVAPQAGWNPDFELIPASL